MKKKILLVTILVGFLNGCASYQPIIDTKGKSKFETSNASDISNDIILCEKLAKNNTTFVSNLGFQLQRTYSPAIKFFPIDFLYLIVLGILIGLTGIAIIIFNTDLHKKIN